MDSAINYLIEAEGKQQDESDQWLNQWQLYIRGVSAFAIGYVEK